MVLKCVFAQGTQSQKCQVTLCQENNGTNCQSISNRGTNMTYLFGFPPGLYTVREVVQVTRDGHEIVLHQAAYMYSRDVRIPHISPCQCISLKRYAFGI